MPGKTAGRLFQETGMNVNNVRYKKEKGLERRMRESEQKCHGAGLPSLVDFLSYCSASPQPSDVDSVQASPVSPGELLLLQITTRCLQRSEGRKTNANTGAARDHFRVIKCNHLISKPILSHGTSAASAGLTDHRPYCEATTQTTSFVCACR